MAVTTVLFDLDGTLLPLDQDTFIKTYFKLLAGKLSERGYEPDKLIEAVWGGTLRMMKNDGVRTNEEVFWEFFMGVFGEKSREDIPYFEEFYKTDFHKAKQVCGFDAMAAQTVRKLKANGVKVALATNPMFPQIATKLRIEWAGLVPDDFELYTTYENSCYGKPSADYYLSIAKTLNVSPEECLMVGNDVDDDMPAKNVGMKVFLLTDNLVNKSNTDINQFAHGGFKELNDYLDIVMRK
ncbi:MAG: HAD family hydrolase [Clostridia bacterium]|nr:HAD family hydrolase [Clostridia bacterium]